jgi:hypothetical protein
LGQDYPVTPAIVREYATSALGHPKSYLAAVQHIASGKRPAASLGHMTVAAQEGVDTDKLLAYRVSQMTCKEKHPGLCKTRDAQHLGHP